MEDVDEASPTYERIALTLDFQPFVSKDVFHEQSQQSNFTAQQLCTTSYRYPVTDVQFNWSCDRGLVYTPHRKRVLTKDTTGALKLWLRRHKKNPYPSKAEKIMLAILSKMTLTQVSTWFANARRRLKKDYPDDKIPPEIYDSSKFCTSANISFDCSIDETHPCHGHKTSVS